MGYSDQQSMQLAKTATMFQNIADAEISAGDAALFINSQLKGFNKEFSKFGSKGEASMHVIDSVNEVANNFAVGTNDLQLALSKTASAMGGFGNSFEQTIGIITAGTEIMVGQPSKVARGWRTIGANITNLAKQTDTYRDASGKVEIQMRKQDGTMKNTYEFLTDLHKEWGNLNNEQKTAIALQFGGKNQMEVFMATMNNFETAIKATNTAMGAQGSASRENAKAIDSLQGHLQNLKRAWEELSYKMISSDALKKGMDILTGTLEFLSSDAGQVVVWGTAIATTFNLIAKGALGLKGLSIVKLFGKLGGALGGAAKGADKASGAFKAMQGNIKNVTSSGASKLFGVFTRLSGSLLGSAGLIAALGLVTVALAKYVDIGEQAKDAKITKEFKEAKSDVKKTTNELKALNDEKDKLKQKEKDGTITDSEKNRLTILENQTKQLERQLALKKEIAGETADDYYHTVDPTQLKGEGKKQYNSQMAPGKTDKQILDTIGINDKIALSLNNVRAEADAVTAAQQKLTEAYEKHGKKSQQYKDALKELGKAQDEQGDTLEKLKKDREDAIKDYGSKEAASKSLGDSWKDLNKEIKALEALQGLNFKEPAKNMKALKKNADTLGLQFDKTGKKIKNVDLKKFNQKMAEAGYNTEDTWNYLKKLGEENPKLKVNVDGSKVAIKDLEFVDGKIQKIKKEKPKAKVEADTKDAKKKLDALQEKYDKLNGKGTTVKVGAKASTGGISQLKKDIKGVKGKNVTVKATTSGKSAVDKLKSAVAKLKSKTINVVTNRITKQKTVKEAHGVRHFAAGGQMVNAEVNEQGFEIIQDANTGLMRVVNGGKRGATYLGEGDSVFTHGQSVRMLRNAGLTEGEAVYGHGDEDFGLFGVKKLKGFKKGKSSKKKNQSAYNKKYNAIKSAMESGLATLEYKKSYYNWTDSEFNAEYKKLYDKQNAALKSLNNSKTGRAKGVKRKTSLGTDIVRAYNLAIREEQSTQAKKDIEDVIANTQGTDSDLQRMLDAINAADQAQNISAEDAKEQRMEAYKKYIDYNLKQYENDKDTYAKSLALIKDYYAKGQLSGEDYYNYLDDLASAQLDKEKERLQEQQDLNESTYDLAKAYVQRQIDLLETENEEQEKQNDLVELQNNLAKARNQRVRIYKEGEGFVYEKDTEAIREATQALQEYQSSANSSEEALNPVLKQWQDVLNLFDELEADYELKALENKVGSTVGELFGSLGTNTSAWSDWIKQNLSTTQGIGDVLTNLDKLVDTNDIINYLDSNGQVSQAIIDAAIGNNVLPATYAAAITQMAQGMSAGVNTAASLATQSSITAATSGAVVMGNATQYGNIYNFDNLVLPNVTNANEFIDGLNNLSTTALQTSTQRG